ncbi:MAG: PLP-dependent aminotransferase family protein [Parvibaculaceae bacterium]
MGWQPQIRNRQGPLYAAIREAIAQDVVSGRLKPGQKLPPHRDLAFKLGVTIGTVARAYAEATERGLVVGEVGRGTFVVDYGSQRAETTQLVVEESNGKGEIIDLGLNLSAIGEGEAMLRDSLDEIRDRATCGELLRYQPAAGMHTHRKAAAEWLARLGLDAEPGSMVICNGGQHAVFLSFMAVARHGETIVTELLTYPGAKAAAHQLGINLAGVVMDEEGIQPDALRELCRIRRPKALYLMPVLQNPTTITTSERRLAEIAEIAREFDLWVIEDDVYGFLALSRPKPIAALIPERSIYLTSASKSMAPGLRVGFIRAPETMMHALQDFGCMTNWMTPPLLAEIVSMWIVDGKADRLVAWHRKQALERQEIAHRWLGEHARKTSASSYHLWLSLPEAWRMDSFATSALREGVRVITADAFAVKRDHAPHAVRLCLGAAFSLGQIEAAMRKLVGIIDSPPRPRMNLEMIA